MSVPVRCKSNQHRTYVRTYVQYVLSDSKDPDRPSSLQYVPVGRNKDADSSGSELSITFVLSIPQEWTPKAFLALLNRSIHENNAVSLEKVSHRDMSCFSLNEVNCFYLCDLHNLNVVLLMEGAYVGVFGGCM
jgi:hypothetical protein